MKNVDLMIEWTYRIPDFVEQAWNNFRQDLLKKYEVSNYFLTGTGGGSRASIDLVNSLLTTRSKRPIYCHQDYLVPSFVNSQTLAIVTSYSGETEESLIAIDQVFERNARIITVSSGGRLQEFAEKRGIPHFELPPGFEARSALPHIFITLLRIMSYYEDVEFNSDVTETIAFLRKEVENALMEGKRLANLLFNKIAIFYGSYALTDAVAERFRRQLAENGKTISHTNIIPNMHHDEIVGYMNERLRDIVLPVFIREFDESKLVKKRFEITKQVLESRGFNTIELFSPISSTRLARIMYLVAVADFTSIFHGILMKKDPKDVSIIRELKERMKNA